MKLPPSQVVQVDQEEEPYVPPDDDRREMVLRATTVRLGQPEFRRALIDRYGSRCMISSCTVEAVIEAAHTSRIPAEVARATSLPG